MDSFCLAGNLYVLMSHKESSGKDSFDNGGMKMTENKNRCVITGLGMVCAIGNSVDETWNNALKGVSGIKNTKTVDTEGCYATLAAEVHDNTLDECPHADEMDRVSKLCVKAAKEALTDAAYTITDDEKKRVSVIMGSCVGGVNSVEAYYRNGEKAEDVAKMPISAIANEVAYVYGADGIVTNIANACAAGTISIAYACDLIRAGKCDVAIAGGADAFASVPYAGFLSLHALAENGCSPFNHCDGITLGEGSGVLIVESYEHAVARGAKIYCEVLGSGVSSDAHHITAPREDGEGQMNAIRWGMKASGVDESEIGYINAHGTGTAKNDMAEFLSLHTIFDDKNDNLSVSSTKAMVGHCLGAAGSIEAVFSIKALTENIVPPTVGYSDEDIENLKEKAGKIDFRPNEPKEKELNTVMNNSFAFGGNNASIIFSKNAGNVELPKKEKVYITGLGVVAPCGNGVENYVEKFNADVRPESTSVASAVGSADYAACGLKMAFYRKLDKFSQLQAVSGMNAIQNAELTINDDNAKDIGIAVGTATGPLATICHFQKDLIEGGNVAGSAFKFPNTVYNAAGGYLSICSGIKGYNVTVTNGAQSGLSSIAYGVEVLRQGKSKIMLATGTDENCDTMTELYDKLGKVATEVDGAYSGMTGYVLGDGSTTLVLESESSVKEREVKPYAEVAGYGMSHEAVAFGELEGSEAALVEAVKLAADDAGMSLDDIDAIVGFGNGDVITDSLELDSYKKLFGDKLGELPIFTVKDTTGEGRAASASLSAAHAALILSDKYEVAGRAYKLDGGTMNRTTVDTKSLKNVLVTSYGLGGSYCAVIIKK